MKYNRQAASVLAVLTAASVLFASLPGLDVTAAEWSPGEEQTEAVTVPDTYADEIIKTWESGAEEADETSVRAEKPVVYETIEINSREDFDDFAANCHYDSWSVDKFVVLNTDLDFSGKEFESAAVFGGIFDGQGHTISGVTLTGYVDETGVFGTILDTGIVGSLHVEGEITPSGFQSTIGGIAGFNYGIIADCTFSGRITADSEAGGIVGRNGQYGMVTGCSTEGEIITSSGCGGIVGYNEGTVTSCENAMSVNTVYKDSNTSLDELSGILDEVLQNGSIFNTGSLTSDSDIGGIAGFSSGVITSCVNRGEVGYEHVGYNVGGIVGRSSGFLGGNTNYADICGRKDVGGIAGQVQPYLLVSFTEETLEELETALETFYDAVRAAMDESDGYSTEISNHLTNITGLLEIAEDSVKDLADETADTVDDASDSLNDAGDRLRTAFNILSATGDEFDDYMDGLGDALSGLGEIDLSDYLSGFGDSLDELLADLADAFPEGISLDLTGSAGSAAAAAAELEALLSSMTAVVEDNVDTGRIDAANQNVEDLINGLGYKAEELLDLAESAGGTDEDADSTDDGLNDTENAGGGTEYTDDTSDGTEDTDGTRDETDGDTDDTGNETDDAGVVYDEADETEDGATADADADTDPSEGGADETDENTAVGTDVQDENDNTLTEQAADDDAADAADTADDDAADTADEQTDAGLYGLTEQASDSPEANTGEGSNEALSDEEIREYIENLKTYQTSYSKLTELSSQLQTAAAEADTENLEAWLDGSNVSVILTDVSESVETIRSSISDMSDIVSGYTMPSPDLSDLTDALDDVADALSDTEDLTDGISGALNVLASIDLQVNGVSDSMRASADILYESVSQMTDEMEALNQSVSGASDSVKDSLSTVVDTFEEVTSTLIDSVEDMLSGDDGDEDEEVLQDISDEDIANTYRGRTTGCVNYGSVDADINVGGIVGLMGVEYSLDPEQDIDSSGNTTLNYIFQASCIVDGCTNRGAVTARSSCAGGVTGRMELGLVASCSGYGTLDCGDSKYVGGIAGYSGGTIRDSTARCDLAGASYVGGIAGYGTTLRRNLSMVRVTGYEQYAGAIAGRTDNVSASVISDNYYYSASLYGIGGVSYQGIAEGVSYEELLSMIAGAEGSDELVLTFRTDEDDGGELLGIITCSYGDSIGQEALPEIPEKEGFYGVWSRTDFSCITEDETILAEYTRYNTLLSSRQTRSGGLAAIEVDGCFRAQEELTVRQQEADEEYGELERWTITIPDDGSQTHQVRYLLPDEEDGALVVRVYVIEDGVRTMLDTSAVSEYVTFEVSGNEVTFAVDTTLTQTGQRKMQLILAGAAILLLLMLLILLRRHRRKVRAV